MSNQLKTTDSSWDRSVQVNLIDPQINMYITEGFLGFVDECKN